jgi:transcription initiation factor TFIID subunit 12
MQQLRNAQQARASPLHANALPYNAGPTTMASPVVNNQILNVNDASLNNTPGQMPGSLPVPLPNLQLPANRQRLLNQAQARQAQPGPGGSIPNGLQQSGQMPLMGMNPQMQQVQNQMTAATAAQVAAFKAQVQNQASLPLGVSQSPRSLQGTPQIGQNAVLPSNVRAGTPNRVASLAGNGLASRQGSINGSPQLNSSPGMANTNIMSGMSLPSNGMLAMSGVTQAMSQQQLQAQLAQIGQQAQAQLQANMQNQGQGQLGMPLSLPGAPVGNQMLQPGMMPPPMPVGSQGLLPPGMLPPGLGGPLNQSQAAQMAQMQARGRPMGFAAPNAIQQQQQQQQQGQPVECPPVSVDVQISQVLPASVNTLPSMTRYPDTKPLHTSLTGGLAAGMTLGLPPHLQRPPSMGRYLAQFQRETAMSGVGKLAMKGTIFEKLKSISKDGDEAEDDAGTTVSVVDPVVKEEKAVVPAVTEEGIAEASTSPKTSKRKLADLAEDLYPRVEISEAAEDVSSLMASWSGMRLTFIYLQVLLELADEFIDSCIEFGCRLAKHRKARKLEVQDIQFHLGREYDINIPGFSSDAIRMDRLRNELKSAATSGAGPNGGMRAQRLAAVAQARAQLRQQVKAAKVAAAAVTLTTTTAPTGDVHTETSLPPTQGKIVVKT